MTTTAGQDAVQPRAAGKAGRRIADWCPEDIGFWERGGARIACRNLVFSVFSEHVGFSVWSLWSVFVLFLTPSYGISHDLKTAAAEKFLLKGRADDGPVATAGLRHRKGVGQPGARTQRRRQSPCCWCPPWRRRSR